VIIVVGVLTALGAESIVEALHWRHEVDMERAALLSETRDNLTAAAYRTEQAACVGQRLRELEEVFRRQAQGQPLGLKRPIGRPPVWVATTGSWDIAVSGQALAHMPQKEKLAFSDAFDSYKTWSRLREEEDQIWRRLDLLDHTRILGPGDWPALHEAYGEAVGMNERIVNIGGYVLGPAALGQPPGRPDPAFTESVARSFCAPLI
jgi:hypothetical protein